MASGDFCALMGRPCEEIGFKQQDSDPVLLLREFLQCATTQGYILIIHFLCSTVVSYPCLNNPAHYLEEKVEVSYEPWAGIK